MSTFGQDFGHDGLPLQTVLEYDTLGVTLDFMLASGLVSQQPSLIKIDVDGIEHLVLRGATRTLAAPSLKSILVEVNESFSSSAIEVNDTLTSAGFVKTASRHSEIFESGDFSRTYNQIWVRK